MIIEIIAITASVCTVTGGIYAVYANIIKPKIKRTRLINLLEMIIQWYDEIDCNLEMNINLSKLNNMEDEIRNYIQENLKTYKIKPSANIIRNWNKKMGFKEELLNSPVLFEEYSRLPAKGMSIEIFIDIIIGNFYSFYQKYQLKSDKCNYADIKMPVKFLDFYIKSI